MNRNRLIHYFSGLVACALFLFTGGGAFAQVNPSSMDGIVSFRKDSVKVRIEFPHRGTEIARIYNGNLSSLESFETALDAFSAVPGSFISDVYISTGSSPVGTTSENIRLNDERAENIRQYIAKRYPNLSPGNVRFHNECEDWTEFIGCVESLDTLDAPWKEKAVAIVHEEPEFVQTDAGLEDGRKLKLGVLADGEAWDYILNNVFPSLKAPWGEVTVSVLVPVSQQVDWERSTVAKEPDVVRDTVVVKEQVIVEMPYSGMADRKFRDRVAGKRFMFALRTNVVAIPLINIGAEFPFGQHFSVGVDYYYPWLQRSPLGKECYQMLAYGMDVRYWLGTDKAPKESRLLGHSFGIYGAGGHYDFERNWEGFQGTFFNIGFDWKYSFPVLHGAMHLEVELGLGMIYSEAQPYDCYEPYGDLFRRPNVKKIVRWYGPTRAQFNIVVPFYRNPFVSKRRK